MTKCAYTADNGTPKSAGMRNQIFDFIIYDALLFIVPNTTYAVSRALGL